MLIFRSRKKLTKEELENALEEVVRELGEESEMEKLNLEFERDKNDSRHRKSNNTSHTIVILSSQLKQVNLKTITVFHRT